MGFKAIPGFEGTLPQSPFVFQRAGAALLEL